MSSYLLVPTIDPMAVFGRRVVVDWRKTIVAYRGGSKNDSELVDRSIGTNRCEMGVGTCPPFAPSYASLTEGIAISTK